MAHTRMRQKMESLPIRHISAKSSFKATQINVAYFGRKDPRYGDGNNQDRDDIDAISILGMGTVEWIVKSVNSEYSGDDGFDVTKSEINLEN